MNNADLIEATTADLDRITKAVTSAHVARIVAARMETHPLPPTRIVAFHEVIEAHGYRVPTRPTHDRSLDKYVGRIGARLVAAVSAGLLVDMRAADWWAMTGSKVTAYAPPAWVAEVAAWHAACAAERDAARAAKAAETFTLTAAEALAVNRALAGDGLRDEDNAPFSAACERLAAFAAKAGA